MNTRHRVRNSNVSVTLNQGLLSDTEDMEDYEEDEDSDNESDMVFVPQRSRRNNVNRIQDTEDYVSDTDVDSTDMSAEEEDGRVAEERPRRQPRYYRIYFPDAEEDASENEDGQASDGAAAASIQDDDTDIDDRLSPRYSEYSPSASSAGGVMSPEIAQSPSAVIDGEDADVRVINGVELVSHQFVTEGTNSGTEQDMASPVQPGATVLSDSAENHSISNQPTENDDEKMSIKPLDRSSNRSEQPSTSKQGTNPAGSSSADQEDEGQMCTICFEQWSNCGEHRIVSLKCGHLFGKICIEKWLKGQGSKCPQCNAKASKKDIRIIYAKTLKVEDTTEKERMTKEIQKLQKIKSQFEREKAQQKIKMELDSQLIRNLQAELKMLKDSIKCSGSDHIASGPSKSKDYKLVLFHSFEVIKTGSCRVMAFNEWMNMLLVSVPSQLEMFPGYGVKKINIFDMKAGNYVPLHSKQIRDLAFNPSKKDLLLSVGLDKVAKITNIVSSACVVSYTTNYPLWACCWNSDRSSEFFAGTSAGTILHFDTVKTANEPIYSYEIGGSGPVVAMTYVPMAGDKAFYLSGLIVTRLSSISFIEILGDGQIEDHPLSVAGPFTHTVFDPVSRHFMTTCRPNNRHLHARHILLELRVEDVPSETGLSKLVSCHEVLCFQGSTTMKVLSRACLVSRPDEKDVSLAVFSEECTNSVKLFDISSSTLCQTINQGMNTVDILPVKGPNKTYIAMLCDRVIRIYHWVEQLRI